MYVNRVTLIAATAVLGTIVCLMLGLPLHADPTTPDVKSAPAAPPAGSQPLEKLIAELKVISELVKQLDDPRFESRQLASDRLVGIGESAIDPLKRVLDSNPSLETATRIAKIINSIRRARPAGTELADLRSKLNVRIALDKGCACPLPDILEYLSDRFEVTFLVDKDALKAIGVEEPEKAKIYLPKVSGVPLRRVLRMALAQVKGDEYQATFLVQGDCIWITTTRHANPIHWQGVDRQGVPTVTCAFDRELLQDALRQLSESTGINIVVDPAALEQARRTVTAEVNDMPVDSAVRLLADMAGLKMAATDMALYVTSKEKAKELEAEQEKRTQPRKPDGAGKAAVLDGPSPKGEEEMAKGSTSANCGTQEHMRGKK